MKVIPEIPFLTFSNADIQFAKKKLIWRFYTTKEALPITWRVEFINKKEFARAVLDKESKTFVVYVTALEALLVEMTIHLLRAA